jgi:hypothetical protein
MSGRSRARNKWNRRYLLANKIIRKAKKGKGKKGKERKERKERKGRKGRKGRKPFKIFGEFNNGTSLIVFLERDEDGPNDGGGSVQ